MPERLTFDSEPLLAFFLDEAGAEIVEEYLSKIQSGELEGFINVVNLAEVYYISYRLDPMLADENYRALTSLGLTVIPVENDDLWRDAAKIKAKYSLSLADAFAVATAKVFKAKLVVGSDREFEGAGANLLRIRK